MATEPKHQGSQFLLFGGEESRSPEASESKDADAPTGSGPREEWIYPPGAFPEDPWPRFLDESADEFAAAQGDPAHTRTTLCRFFKRGAALAEHEELIDALGLSAGNVLERAGLSDEEALAVMKVLPTLTLREIKATPLE